MTDVATKAEKGQPTSKQKILIQTQIYSKVQDHKQALLMDFAEKIAGFLTKWV